MTLESIINFEKSQKVKLNPGNHGYSMVGHYLNMKEKIGFIKKVCPDEKRVTVITVKKQDKEFHIPKTTTGYITVLWKGAKKTVKLHYQRLLIL